MRPIVPDVARFLTLRSVPCRLVGVFTVGHALFPARCQGETGDAHLDAIRRRELEMQSDMLAASDTFGADDEGERKAALDFSSEEGIKETVEKILLGVEGSRVKDAAFTFLLELVNQVCLVQCMVVSGN